MATTERERPGDDASGSVPRVEPLPALDPAALPAFRRWRDEWRRPDFTLWDYVRSRADAELAAALSAVVWPHFTEASGCVLLAERHDPARLAEWLEAAGGDARRVEAAVNHVHLYDLFPGREVGEGEYPLAAAERVAQMLRRTWRAALAEAFPGVPFVVTYATEPDEYGPTLSFHRA